MTQPYRELAGMDRLIHEPGRLAIMAVLCVSESADFHSILHTIGLSRGNLSRHLSKLEEAGYVHITKTFQGKVPRTICSLTEKGREAFEGYRGQLERAISSLPHAAVRDPHHGQVKSPDGGSQQKETVEQGVTRGLRPLVGGCGGVPHALSSVPSLSGEGTRG